MVLSVKLTMASDSFPFVPTLLPVLLYCSEHGQSLLVSDSTVDRGMY